MFDIGFSELVIIGVVALLVLGPDKLPVAVRTCGLWVGRIRRSVGNIQREISEELRVDELRRTAAMKKEELDKELSEMRRPFSGDEASAQSSDQPAPTATVDEAGTGSGEKKSDTP